MRLKDFQENQIPALVGRNGAKVEKVSLEELAKVGTPFSGAGMAVGDTVEVPEDVMDNIQRVQVRPNSESYDYRFLALKNGNLAWLSIGFFNRQDKDNVPVHPVAESLAPLHDHAERLAFLAGKKIVANESVDYTATKWVDGRRIDGEYDLRKAPKCEYAN